MTRNNIYEFDLYRSQWVIADSKAKSVKLFLEHNQYSTMADFRRGECASPKPVRLDDGMDFELIFDGHRETRTCAEWCEEFSEGFLCEDVG